MLIVVSELCKSLLPKAEAAQACFLSLLVCLSVFSSDPIHQECSLLVESRSGTSNIQNMAGSIDRGSYKSSF